MFGALLNICRRKRGQAMVESMLTLLLILVVFLALFSLADNLRVKLLAETAAVKCARARAVGYNDFQLRKIARLAMMPASGKCLTETGSEVISYPQRISRIGSYLNSSYETQANMILDFDGWRDARVRVNASEGSEVVAAEVCVRRSNAFDFTLLTSERKERGEIEINGSGKCEAHYTDYLR